MTAAKCQRTSGVARTSQWTFSIELDPINKDTECTSCTSGDELGALLRKLAGAHNVRMLQRVQLIACYGIPQLCGEVC